MKTPSAQVHTNPLDISTPALPEPGSANSLSELERESRENELFRQMAQTPFPMAPDPPDDET